MITPPVFWILMVATGAFFGLLIGYAVGYYIGRASWFYRICWKCGAQPRREDL